MIDDYTGKKYRASIITSIFKSGRFIEHFMQDITKQTAFDECEFLLLDANSQDGEYEIIKKYLHLPNIKYFNVGNCSIYEAWNKGIDLSSSEILSNWNTDDRRSPDSLRKQIEFLELNKESDVCYGHTIISFNENESFQETQSKQIYPALEGTIENQMMHNSPHCLPMWRKSIHDRFGKFDTLYFSGADYDMWFRVLKGGGTLSKLDIITGLYYRNPNGISSNQKNLEKAIKEVGEIRKKYSQR